MTYIIPFFCSYQVCTIWHLCDIIATVWVIGVLQKDIYKSLWVFVHHLTFTPTYGSTWNPHFPSLALLPIIIWHTISHKMYSTFSLFFFSPPFLIHNCTSSSSFYEKSHKVLWDISVLFTGAPLSLNPPSHRVAKYVNFKSFFYFILCKLTLHPIVSYWLSGVEGVMKVNHKEEFRKLRRKSVFLRNYNSLRLYFKGIPGLFYWWCYICACVLGWCVGTISWFTAPIQSLLYFWSISYPQYW